MVSLLKYMCIELVLDGEDRLLNRISSFVDVIFLGGVKVFLTYVLSPFRPEMTGTQLVLCNLFLFLCRRCVTSYETYTVSDGIQSLIFKK